MPERWKIHSSDVSMTRVRSSLVNGLPGTWCPVPIISNPIMMEASMPPSTPRTSAWCIVCVRRKGESRFRQREGGRAFRASRRAASRESSAVLPPLLAVREAEPEDGERFLRTSHRDDVAYRDGMRDMVPIEEELGMTHLVQDDERPTLVDRPPKEREAISHRR